MKRMAIVVSVAACLSFGGSGAQAANYISDEGLWNYYEDIYVPTEENPEDSANPNQIELPANVFVPTIKEPGQTFPAIIFINSWTLNEHEYAGIAKDLANRGYVVLRYTTRGFWGSPGQIDTSGNKDVADASNAISYVINNYPVDPNKIALGGTSYGSGIALSTAMQDERVAAAIATSTWGSMKESLWPNQTPKEDWINTLMNSSVWPIGDQDPEIQENLDNLHAHKNVDATIAWAMERSPISYIDLANQREKKPAVYVTNNLHDYLFHPNSIVKFLEKYEGPWHIDFNFGTHGAGEAAGLSGKAEESYVWQNAYAWLDHYLKDENNYIDQIDRVSTRVKSTTGATHDSYPGFPIHDQIVTLFADPQAGTQGGELNDTGTINADTPQFDSQYDVVWTGGVIGAEMMSGHFYRLEAIDPQGALVYTSPVLTENLYLRGAPVLKFSAYVKDKIQFFGYLLDLDPATGEAHWIGHGPFTWHTEEGSNEVPETPVNIAMEMLWTAHDVAAGHQILLVIDGEDSEYYRYDDSPSAHQLVIDSTHPLSVDIPVAYERHRLDTIETRQALAEKAAAEADPSRSSNGSGETYGPGGGALGGLSLLIASCLFTRHRSRR